MKLSNYLHLPGQGTVTVSGPGTLIGACKVSPLTIEVKPGPPGYAYMMRADFSDGAWVDSPAANPHTDVETLKRMLFDEWPMYRVRVVGVGGSENASGDAETGFDA